MKTLVKNITPWVYVESVSVNCKDKERKFKLSVEISRGGCGYTTNIYLYTESGLACIATHFDIPDIKGDSNCYVWEETARINLMKDDMVKMKEYLLKIYNEH